MTTKPTASITHAGFTYRALKRNRFDCEEEAPIYNGIDLMGFIPCTEPAAVEVDTGIIKRFCRACYNRQHQAGEPTIADLRELIGWKD